MSTGWPGPEFPQYDVAYTLHANAKLSAEQKNYIAQSGEAESQWIRDAVQQRMDREAHYQRANERHKETEHYKGLALRQKIQQRMEEVKHA